MPAQEGCDTDLGGDCAEERTVHIQCVQEWLPQGLDIGHGYLERTSRLSRSTSPAWRLGLWHPL